MGKLQMLCPQKKDRLITFGSNIIKRGIKKNSQHTHTKKLRCNKRKSGFLSCAKKSSRGWVDYILRFSEKKVEDKKLWL